MAKGVKTPNVRTEEEKLVRAPIVVILGGNKYEIAPLVIRDSREWRKKAIALMAPLPGLIKTNTDDMDAFGKVLAELLVTMPDQVLDLFFEYAKDLNRKEIEGIATDAEMAEAFGEVVKIAFPLAESLPKAMERLSR